jgi:GntR family transcriptional repressor for pyruvate dehydrogenase complex
MHNSPKSTVALKTPSQRQSVVTYVVKKIEEALIAKEIKPGDYLPPEAVLANDLNVGKSSVREALKMLQAMGVVDIRQGQGTQIRTRLGERLVNPLVFQLIIENNHPREVIELRKMFEPAYTMLAMENATDQDIAIIEQMHDRFETAIHKGTQTAEDDIGFHMAIIQATHNQFVIRLGQTILELFKPAMEKSLKGNPEAALRDHRSILEAFKVKDEKKVRRAIVDSFENWKTGLDPGEGDDN